MRRSRHDYGRCISTCVPVNNYGSRLDNGGKRHAGASPHRTHISSGTRQLHFDQEFRADSHPTGVYFVKCQLNSVNGDLYSHKTHTHTRFKFHYFILAISSIRHISHALHTSTVVRVYGNTENGLSETQIK